MNTYRIGAFLKIKFYLGVESVLSQGCRKTFRGGVAMSKGAYVWPWSNQQIYQRFMQIPPENMIMQLRT